MVYLVDFRSKCAKCGSVFILRDGNTSGLKQEYVSCTPEKCENQMAKPIKLKNEEAESTVFECTRCGSPQTSPLTRCPECHKLLCDICTLFGDGVSCIECADPDIDRLDLDF